MPLEPQDGQRDRTFCGRSSSACKSRGKGVTPNITYEDGNKPTERPFEGDGAEAYAGWREDAYWPPWNRRSTLRRNAGIRRDPAFLALTRFARLVSVDALVS